MLEHEGLYDRVSLAGDNLASIFNDIDVSLSTTQWEGMSFVNMLSTLNDLDARIAYIRKQVTLHLNFWVESHEG